MQRYQAVSRRDFIAHGAALGVAGFAGRARAAGGAPGLLDLPFANGERELVGNFPQKGPMILQRTRPPLLETPFAVFDQGVYTPNDRFFVRWHLANIPTRVDPAQFRLQVHGSVRRSLALTLDEIVRKYPAVEIAAVNQCSGNSRGYSNPRVPGAQWSNGAMGNALWRGVRLKDVLDDAGIAAGTVQVRFKGLESGVIPQTPHFMKSLAIDHARDGEVMIAYAMNGAPLPLLNGFPLRLIVPGWYSTYWTKMLCDIEVLDKPDDNYWTTQAYQVPDTPGASMRPGQAGVRMVPLTRMVPRSFFTNLVDGQKVARDRPLEVRGIAFGGDAGVGRVRVSADAGRTWQDAQLEKDYGPYSFRRWTHSVRPHAPGPVRLQVQCVNTHGVAQPAEPGWNPGGFMRNAIETVSVVAS